MTKFIKLTEAYKDGTGYSPILLNTSGILSIKKSDSGDDTHIFCSKDRYFFVKESVEEIELMLNIGLVNIKGNYNE